jgi:heme-degrading monooxygenase HmoA
MIQEIAQLEIREGENAAFEAAIEDALATVHTRAEGMRGYRLQRCIENPQRYVLQVWWDSVEHHMVRYRESPLSPRFRELVRPYFAQPASFQHFAEAFHSAVLPG